jgi:hypothetical protein
MDKKCHICNKPIKDGEEYKFSEMYGYSHKNCIRATASEVVAKPKDVATFSKSDSSVSEEDADRVVDDNTLEDLND